MSVKEKILLGFLTVYWIAIGIALTIIHVLGLMILIAVIFTVFVKNKYVNIIGICGLYLASLLILIYTLAITIYFSRLNEIIDYIPFLISIINFIITYYIFRLSRIKNDKEIE